MNFDKNGWLIKNNKKSYLKGLNYLNRKYGHRSSWWKEMDFSEIKKDFEIIRSFGADAIRIPLPMILMPKKGIVDKNILKNFSKIVNLADEFDLGVIPNPFHSGRVEELPWMNPQKVYTSPSLFSCYVKVLKALIKPYRTDNRIIAWDICSEPWWMLGRPPSRKIFSQWMLKLISSAKSLKPVQPLIFGFDHSGIVFDVGGDIDLLMDNIDMMVMHSYSRYPIGAILVDDVNSLRDTYYNSFILRRSVAKPMPNGSLEFGNNTLYMSEEKQKDHMRVVLYSLLVNGSQSFFPWVFTDFDQSLSDYYKDGLTELRFGMVRTDRSFKPVVDVLKNFYEFLDYISPDDFQLLPYDTAIYVPLNYYDNLSYWSKTHFNTFCLAKQAGLNAGFTRFKDDWSSYKSLIVSGNNISFNELNKIIDFANNGGNVLFIFSHNRADIGLFSETVGAKIEEIRTLDNPLSFSSISSDFGLSNNDKFSFSVNPLDGLFKLVLSPEKAKVLMIDEEKNPVLLLNRLGKGNFLTLTVPLPMVVSEIQKVFQRSCVWKIFRVLKEVSGIHYPVEVTHPAVETGLFKSYEGFIIILINHEKFSVKTNLKLFDNFSSCEDFFTHNSFNLSDELEIPPSDIRIFKIK